MLKIKLACLVAGLALGAVLAGPLNPPGGPVASTYKTLADIEPRTAVQSLPGDSTAQYIISQSGSYYLAGGITGVAGKKGISVRADDVTIDLRGQTMDGANAGTMGINLESPTGTGLCVRNGILCNWTSNCVGNQGESGRLESIRAFGSSQGTALYVGAGSIVLNCSVTGTSGIHADDSSLLEGCTVEGASPFLSVRVNDGCGLHDCSTGGSGSANNLYAGIGFGSGCTITGCTARGGPSWGLLGWDDCTISKCMVYSNAGGGIGVR